MTLVVLLTATLVAAAPAGVGPAGAAALRGTVVARDGGPVAGGFVIVDERIEPTGTPPDTAAWNREVGRHALTDSLGRFTIDGLTKGASYGLAIGADGFHGDWAGPFGPLGKSPDPVVRLVRQEPKWFGAGAPNRIIAHVIDPAGAPLAAVRVSLRQVFDEPQPVGGPGDTSTTTRIQFPPEFSGPSGDAVLLANPGGRYQLEALAQGYAPSVARDVPAPNGAAVRCTIRMARGASLHGRVELPGGAPPGRPMTLHLARLDDANFAGDSEADVDSAGRWQAGFLTPGSDFAIVAAAGGAVGLGTAQAVVAHTGPDGSTSEAPVVRAARTVLIAGRLRLPTGRALPRGAKLAAARELPYVNRAGAYHEDLGVGLDPAGRFTLRGVPGQTIELLPLVDSLVVRPADAGPLRWDPSSRRYRLRVRGAVRDLAILLVPAPPPPPESPDY